MGHLLAAERAEWIISAVSQATGGLTPDEYAVVYGAAAAQYSTWPGQGSHPNTLAWLAHAVVALRSGPCRWCGQDLTRHAIDIVDGLPSSAAGTTRDTFGRISGWPGRRPPRRLERSS